MKFIVDPIGNGTTTTAGLKYTSTPFRTGYWRGANGKYYSLSRIQKGTQGWVFYKGSADIAQNSVKWLGRIGNGFGVLSTAYNGYNFVTNPNWESGIETTVGIGSYFFWEIGAVYYGGKLFFKGIKNYNNTLINNGLVPGKDDLIIWK